MKIYPDIFNKTSISLLITTIQKNIFYKYICKYIYIIISTYFIMHKVSSKKFNLTDDLE